MAVHLADYFPEIIDFKNKNKNIIKKTARIKALYLKLEPKLFKQKWISFLKELK